MTRFVAPIVTFCLLGMVAVDSSGRRHVPEDANAYHARVAEALDLIPYRIGDWVGVDNGIREEALQILDANASLSRTYHHIGTGHSAVVLLVHSADARSLLGHYPPVCYPPQGWTQLSSEVRRLHCPDIDVTSTLYEFSHDTLGHSTGIEVAHFAVLPNGTTAPNLDPLDKAAKNKASKFYGGASLQIIVASSLPEARRQEIREDLLEALSPWLKAIKMETKP